MCVYLISFLFIYSTQVQQPYSLSKIRHVCIRRDRVQMKIGQSILHELELYGIINITERVISEDLLINTHHDGIILLHTFVLVLVLLRWEMCVVSYCIQNRLFFPTFYHKNSLPSIVYRNNIMLTIFLPLDPR